MGSLQELDHVDLMRPITKFATTVYQTQRIPEILGMAFRQAYSGRPGPVFVEIPADVLFAPFPKSAAVDPGIPFTGQGPRRRPPGRRGRPATLQTERPSWRAVRSGCSAPRRAASLRGGRCASVYLNGSPAAVCRRAIRFCSCRSRREALYADVILLIGTPFDFRLGYGKRLAADAIVIQVDLDYGELGHNRGVELGIAGDAAGPGSHLHVPCSTESTPEQTSALAGASVPRTENAGKGPAPVEFRRRAYPSACGWPRRSTIFSRKTVFSSATAATW